MDAVVTCAHIASNAREWDLMKLNRAIVLLLLSSIALPVGAQCNVVLGGGGAADYGQVAYATLEQSTEKKLDARIVSASFSCTGPTLFAITLEDDRLASNSKAASPQTFGLGKASSGANIGHFIVSTTSPTIDGSAGAMLVSSDSSSWSNVGANVAWARKNSTPAVDIYRAFGAAGAVAAANTASVDLVIEAVIQGRDALRLTEPAELDGNAILEIVYL
jgi:hypothetical protein